MNTSAVFRLEPMASTLPAALLGAAFLTLSAKLSLLVPGHFVALTGHVGALCLLCLLFPLSAARGASYCYLIGYLCGLPIASAPISFSIFSPILGYLAGFCLFVETFGCISKRLEIYPLGQLIALSASLCPLYAMGFLGLCLHMPPLQAFLQGVMPFILVDSAKILFTFFAYKMGKNKWKAKSKNG